MIANISMFLIDLRSDRSQVLSEGAERNLMAMHVKCLFSQLALLSGAISFPAFAQEKIPAPSVEFYEDVGQGIGMEWSFQTPNGKPILEFGVKETDHRLDRLWELSCAGVKSGGATISNTIFATAPELRNDDQFGFSIRIDNGKSLGMIGRKSPFQIQGNRAYFPRFTISDTHKLWDALRRGERAFVNLNGNRFSFHLTESGDAINEFLGACRKIAS